MERRTSVRDTKTVDMTMHEMNINFFVLVSTEVSFLESILTTNVRYYCFDYSFL